MTKSTKSKLGINCKTYKFFLEHVGELHIIVLIGRKKVWIHAGTCRKPTSEESTENVLTLMPTVHPTVCAGRAIAEPFKIRCTSEDFPTPENREKLRTKHTTEAL